MSNIIPFELHGVNTDDAKIYNMKYDKNNINNFNKSYKVGKLIKEGLSIDKIPDELIYEPQKLKYQSDLDVMCLHINKLVYLKEYDKAEKLINKCMNSKLLLPNSRNNFKITLIM